MRNKLLPVGIDDFNKLRKENFYYVDKTCLIRDLLNNWGEVNLFTRPRRFGKTLNMSMLKYFFEIGTDKSLFEGLVISKETALCEEYMGKYPVIFISLKGVDGLCFQDAYGALRKTIRSEVSRFRILLDSLVISEDDRDFLERILHEDDSYADVCDSLRMLSYLLNLYYGKKVILLIDEYDVPLDKAYKHGYYKEMVSLLRSLFGQALKTNNSLFFAVLTGCLRVSKESIFTGLNNLKVLSITDTRFDEGFGFTETEVKTLFSVYNIENRLSEAKEWYDGYRFGDKDVYCPWDVINYVDLISSNSKARPEAFWINSSGNDLVKRFIDKADRNTRADIEHLIAGESIERKVRLDLTYDELDSTIDNLWSVLFTTGYLTQKGIRDDGTYSLVIPNREVREVFVLYIQEWFKEKIVEDKKPMSKLCRSLLDGDYEGVERGLNTVLNQMISVLDTKAREGEKENFYHGLLLGLLRSQEDWLIVSNRESGDGYPDIIVEPDDIDKGIIIEVKYSPRFDGLEGAADKAIRQIREKRYSEKLYNEGKRDILIYGIAFSRKRCKVVSEKL
ncbi:MAG: ATP-binding protein [Spirochaetales bacterium]|nr:ATP-binding protein [Spirochaetales bacterium]